MANTTWSTTDKDAAVTLSGGNLVATFTGLSSTAVRSADLIRGGKYYWEITGTTLGGGFQCGITTGNAARANLRPTNPATDACMVASGGGVYNGGAQNASASFAAFGAGNVACFALDASSAQLWIRIGAAGNWNNSANANPATGAGGLLLSWGTPITDFFAFGGGNSNAVLTANFGDSAFTGAAPSGFTSGFTAGTVASLAAAVTTAALEQWAAGNPDARLTSVAVEQWASIAQSVLPAGIASGEALGSPTLTLGGATVSLSGIPSAEALGAPTITAGAASMPVTGIPSAEALGVATLSPGAVSISPTGIPSSEALGTPTLALGLLLVTGIPSAEALGTPTLSPGGRTLSLTGIASSEALGTPTLHLTSAAAASAFFHAF
jgi:hypothetical protein